MKKLLETIENILKEYTDCKWIDCNHSFIAKRIMEIIEDANFEE